MRKKLFKVALLLIAISTSSMTVSAQGAYATLNFGVGFNAASGNMTGFTNTTSTPTNTGSIETEEQITTSLGKGLNFGGSFGYMFNKNIGAEMGINYLQGAKTEASWDYKSSFFNSNTQLSVSANMLRFMPTIVLSTGMEKLNPYAKLGVVIGSGEMKYEINQNSDGDVVLMKGKLSGDFAFGYTASIGVNYLLSNKLSLFSELNMISMSYAPSKGEITESSVNGISELNEMTTSEKKTDFVDKVTTDTSVSQNDDVPSQELKESYPFSSFGINIGLRYNF